MQVLQEFPVSIKKLWFCSKKENIDWAIKHQPVFVTVVQHWDDVLLSLGSGKMEKWSLVFDQMSKTLPTKDNFLKSLTDKCVAIRDNGYMFACLSAGLCNDVEMVSSATAHDYIQYFLENTECKDMMMFITSATSDGTVVIGCNTQQGKEFIPNTYTANGNFYTKTAEYPVKEEPETMSLIFAALKKTDWYPDEEEDNENGCYLFD